MVYRRLLSPFHIIVFQVAIATYLRAYTFIFSVNTKPAPPYRDDPIMPNTRADIVLQRVMWRGCRLIN